MRYKAAWPLALLALLIAGCSGSGVRGDGPGSARIPELPGDAVPRKEARSRYGNGPVYEVFGQRYTVLGSSRNYRERGVASWYGKKFHGRLTSNREVYDMYAMTAAHKSLPLPTYVHVRNLVNDKSVIVRVNDRGPFVHNRIIDLSYAAALKLDMVGSGTSMVEVTAYNFDGPDGDVPTRAMNPPQPEPEPSRPKLVSVPSVVPDEPVSSTADNQPAASTATASSGSSVPEPPVDHRIFVQVGAFGDRSNAARRLTVLESAGIADAFIHEDTGTDATLYRVRIGPVADVVQYDILVEELENLGIVDPYLIAE